MDKNQIQRRREYILSVSAESLMVSGITDKKGAASCGKQLLLFCYPAYRIAMSMVSVRPVSKLVIYTVTTVFSAAEFIT